MRKTALLTFALAVLSMSAWGSEDLPNGAIRKGTLANGKLIQDAKVGVAQKVATMGCTQLGDVEPYVLAMPSGQVGQRRWSELWVVAGCNSKYPVTIEFWEQGVNAANWSIGK